MKETILTDVLFSVDSIRQDLRKSYVLSWDREVDREAIIEEYENPWTAQYFWQQKFGDSVPEHYAVWHRVLDEINEADKQQKQLGKNLLEAAVFHFVPWVVREAGLKQTLNDAQLAFLLLRPDLKSDTKQLIEIEQKKRNRKIG